jgi:hypothetical protein
MVRYVGLGKESTYGTAVAASRYLESVTSMKPDHGFITQTPIQGRYPTKRGPGPYRCRGNLGDFDLEPENMGELLYGVFGSVVSTNVLGSVYNHVFTPADTLPSYTMRIGAEAAGSERILAGCLANSLTLKFPHDGALKGNAEMLSGFVETRGALGSPSFSTLKALNMYGSTSVLTIAGTSLRSQIYDLQVTIENNIPFQRGSLDGRTFSVKRYGLRRVSGKISMYFDDIQQYDKFLNQTEFTLIVRADGDVIQAGYKYYLNLELRKCLYPRDAAPDLVSQEELMVLNAPFEALYDTTGGFNAEAKATLQNTVTAY